MNLPNKLSIFRIILIPFAMYFMMNGGIPYNMYIALVIFAVACFTDFLDGYIARKYNLVTNLGKFLDPLADKMLVISVLVCFVELGYKNVWWVLALIVARELAITGFRVIAADKKVVIAANMLGKIKTNFQMAWVILLFLPFHDILVYNIITDIIMYLTAGFTVVSFIVYIIQNKKVLQN